MMKKISLAFVALVALEHVYILVLEMFLWTSERSLKAFGMTLAQAETCKTLAANQGLYNGFLAAGLFWSFTLTGKEAYKTRAFFFICVLVAGIYGAATAKPSIILIQGVPATLGLIFLWLAERSEAN